MLKGVGSAPSEDQGPQWHAAGATYHTVCPTRYARSSSLQFGGPARGQAGRPGPSPREGGVEGDNDAEADMPLAEAAGAICVQRFDDSHNSAIHTTYRISLRSSSLREPRYPLLRVVIG